jgi:excisionase family DNA binding protein
MTACARSRMRIGFTGKSKGNLGEAQLTAFLAHPRSPGRKGPRKKREIRQSAQGNRMLLSTAEAHEVSGYRQDHLLRLLRAGRIEGEKTGRTWLIYEDSLLAYKRRKHPSKMPPFPQ